MTGKNHSFKTARIKDVAELDPETLGESTAPDFTFKYIDLSSVKGGRIGDELESMTFAAAPGRARKLIKEGDVLLGMVRPYLKPFAKVQTALDGHVASTGFAVIRAKSGVTDPEYLYQTIWSDSISKQIHQMVTGSNYPALSVGDVKDLKIPLPPLAEQRKIAEILRTWDEAIETAESELKAKQERKRWLMDKLFGPALVDRQQGWRRVQLGHCFSERSENGHPGLTLLSITGEHGVVDRELIGRRDTSAPDKGKYRRICPGDIGYNTMRMWQGVCGLSGSEGIVSPAYTILRPLPGTNAAFMCYLFKCPAMIAKFHSRSQGLVKDTLNLKFPAFSKISVNLPDADIQKHIVHVLEKADEELNLTREYTESLRTQKRGLMQKLLTGEVRVAA